MAVMRVEAVVFTRIASQDPTCMPLADKDLVWSFIHDSASTSTILTKISFLQVKVTHDAAHQAGYRAEGWLWQRDTAAGRA